MLIAIVNGPDGEQVSEFEDQSIVLGRHGTFRLNDRKVSKQHARLQSDGGAWYVEDMGSKNGTFVNGVRVVRPCRVKEGDRLRLGQTQVVLSKLSSPERLHAPRMQFAEPAAAQVSVAQPSAVPPISSDAREESGFLTLSAGDLLESAEFSSAQLDLEVPPLDLQEATPTTTSAEADAAMDDVSPVAEAAPAEDVAPANDVQPTADAAPVEDAVPADDVAVVEDVTTQVPPSEDVTALDHAAASLDVAPPTDFAAVSEPIEEVTARDDATAPIDDAPPTQIEAAPESMDDAATADASIEAASADLSAIEIENLPQETIARDADLAAADMDPAPFEAITAPDAPANAEERRPDELLADDFAPTADAADDAVTTDDAAQPSWTVEPPPVAMPASEFPELAAATAPAEDSQPIAEEPRCNPFGEQSTTTAAAANARSGRELSRSDDTPTSAPDDDESLAAFMNVLPQRRSGKPLTRLDETILSIRPLALREELAALQPPPVSPWRRSIPYAMLSLVLLAVIANLALLMMFRRDASRDAAALQESLKKQQQMSAELVLQEVREELRAPVAENAQAIQALGNSVLAKQEALAEKLQAQLAAATTVAREPAAAPEDEKSRRAAEESRAALMHELNEIKTALADMRKVAEPPAPVVASAPPAAPTDGKPSDAAPSVAARGDDSTATESRSPAREASAAPAAAVIGPRKGYAQSFVIDASGALQNSIPEAVAEVRRAIETARSNGNVRILLLYQGRLIELPPAALTTPGTAEPIDRGEADLAAAVKAALKDRPVVLNLLSDTLGGGDAVSTVLRQADMSGTSVNVTQFFARNSREQLKSLAREFHGTYGYVPPRGQ